MEPFIKYKVRPGTIDYGKEYESKILSLLSLQCLQHSCEDFWFACNVDGVGGLDDIILQYGANTFMFQIKHQDNPKPITENELLSLSRKDFSITSYLQDIYKLELKLNSSDTSKDSNIFKKLGASNNIYYFLYTNRNANQCNVLKKISKDDLQFSYLTSKDDCEVFKFDKTFFTVHNDCIDNFYLFTGQIHVKDISRKIEEKLNKMIKNDEVKVVRENFLKFLIEWGKGNLGGHYCLRKQDIVQKLSDLLFSKYELKLTQEVPYKFYESEQKLLWNKMVSDKLITVVSIKSEDKLIFEFLLEYIGSEVRNYVETHKTNWGCTFSEKSQNKFYSNHTDLKFSILKIVSRYGKITPYDVYKCLWYTNRLPLLLEINKNDQYKQVLNILKLSNYSFKIIIVDRSNEPLVLNNGINHFISLNELTEGDRNKIISQKVKLQGKPGVPLKDLIDETMFIYIKVADIINVLINNFNIGKELPSVPNYYIPRKLTRIFIKFAALKNIVDEIFIIEDTTNHFQFKTRRENLKTNFIDEVNFTNLNMHNIVIVNNQDKIKIEKLFSFNRTVHYLVFYDFEYLEWKKSCGNIQKILDYKTEVISTTESHIDFLSNYITIISAAPGMGKSLLMNHVSLELPPNMWVLRIDLNAHQDYYESDNCKYKANGSLDHLNYFRNPSENILHNKVFEKLMQNKNIILFLDGFDEISILYKAEVTNIAKGFISDKFHVCITTRPLMKSYLEEELNCLALSLIHFSEDNQKQFLYKYFMETITCITSDTTLVLDEFIEKLLNAFKKNINDIDGEFTGIPLHIKLLAEAFSNDCEQFLTNKENKGFNEKFDLLDLYDRFIKKKIRILCDKFGLGSKDLRILYKDYQSIYALKLLFFDYKKNIDECLNTLYKFKKDNIRLIQKEGLLTLDERFNVNFVHRTFAEYLAAEWLVENLDHENYEIKSLVKTLITKRFTQGYKFLFNILDRLLIKDCPLHLMIMNGQVNEASTLVNACSTNILKLDRANRSILHMLALYVVQYPLLINISVLVIEIIYSKMPKMKKDLIGYNPLDYALANHSFKIADLICKTWQFIKINIEIDRHLEGRFLNSALFGYKFLFKILLKHFAYKGLMLRKINKDMTVYNFIYKSITHVNHEKLVEFKTVRVSDILNLAEFNDNPNIFHEVVFGNINCVKNTLNIRYINTKDNYGYTCLHYAVVHNKLEIVDFLLLNGADVNMKNPDLETTLHTCVRFGHFEVMQKLLCCKPNINAQDDNENTLLHTSIICNEFNIADLLINNNADINIQNSDGNTSIHLMIKENCNSILCKLLSKGVYNDIKNSFGETPLLLSLKREKADIAKLLISNGADLNSVDEHGESILDAAIKSDNTEIVKLIVSKMAILDDVKHLPLHTAVKNHKSIDMMKVLLQSGCSINTVDRNGKSVLYYAVKVLDVNLVKTILDYGACTNNYDKDFNTPLHVALNEINSRLFRKPDADSDRISIARLLIQGKSDVNATNHLGKTSMHYLFQNNMLEIVFEILDNKLKTFRKIDFNIKDNCGNTVLHQAIKTRNLACIRKILLKDNIMINAQDDAGDTILHLATSLCELEIVKLLCRKGVDANIKNYAGCTAFHTAANCKSLEILKELLKLDRNNKNINDTNGNGSTLVHITAENNFTDGLKLVLDCGGDVDRCDNNGETALHIAVRNSFFGAVKVLFDYQPDIDILNKDKKTSQTVAYEIGNDGIIHLFQNYCVKLFCTTNRKK